MDPVIISLLAVAALILLIFLGIHIASALISVSLISLWLITGGYDVPFNMLGIAAYRGIMEYIFGTMPLFVVMGLLVNVAGASQDLYEAANLALRRVRGGLGIATVMANAVFAAVSGVSVASAAVFSKIAVPQMLRLGYNKKLALGTVAGSSILGMLIPPSMLFIFYGILTEESIGKLFMAGVLPGIVMACIFSAGIMLMVWFKPSLAPKILNGLQEKRRSSLLVIAKPWPVVGVILLVLGGMYLGFTTPTEAAAVGAVGGLLLAIGKKRFKIRNFWGILLEVGVMNSAVYFLIISALLFSKMLSFSGFTAAVTEFVLSFNLPPLAVIWAFIVVVMLLGCFLDSTSIMLISIPMLAPIVKAMGFDLIWFGVVVTVAIELGLLTPPFGMVVFAVSAAMGDEATVEEIFVGAFPFFLMMIVGLAIIVHVPWLST
ncbi:MAG: TRAP transporter large permease, partial [Pseudomonadota bacterium]